MSVSKEDLLKQRFGVEDFEIPGVGVVKIRSLTRAEALQVRGVELAQDVLEQRLLSWALVEPKLSEADVKAWQEACPAGELEPVVDAIVKLSGLATNASKEAVRQFRG